MTEHDSATGLWGQTLEAYGLACQILEVRAVLVAQVFRGIKVPEANPLGSPSGEWAVVPQLSDMTQVPEIHDQWGRFLKAIESGDAQRIADREWALRAALFAHVGQGLALSLLLQGDGRLCQSCGQRPPAVNATQRLSAMKDLIKALQASAFTEALRAAITQVELDQCDLKSFFERD